MYTQISILLRLHGETQLPTFRPLFPGIPLCLKRDLETPAETLLILGVCLNLLCKVTNGAGMSPLRPGLTLHRVPVIEPLQNAAGL
jgi:hypothetical protein